MLDIEIDCIEYLEYYKIVRNILNSDDFQKRKEFKHHGDISVYQHSLEVSFLAYEISKKMDDVDSTRVAIGGLLHDFYSEPWQEKHQPLFSKENHCFKHAHEALLNSKELYGEYLDDIIEDIIEKHMYPLNSKPPKYKEGWLITIVDKLVSLEVLTQPAFFKRTFVVNNPKLKEKQLKKEI